MASKRKLEPSLDDETLDETDYLSFICLGGGMEVGRSCHILQYKGKVVMLDAGVHPAYEGLSSLPFYDEFDLSTVDILLISHFHLDHASSLPYVLTKTNFRGRVYMTHPTKAIYKWLISDSVRLGNTHPSPSTQLYNESDHLSSFSQISAIDYYQTLHHSGISFTPYPAGHVLGAAMFLVEIAGLKILFTGDYSREDDRHLVSATLPKNIKPDVLITESTYGNASHMPRLERESRLLSLITNALDRGGRVLLPVFALGRAQELLLILEEYWEMHDKYRKYPIYYASSLAKRCMSVYQTYIHAMNDNIKSLFRSRMAAIGDSTAANKKNTIGGTNPFEMRWVRSLKSLDRFEDVGGCVMLASPGMLQNGVSRELLERWCPDARNAVIITGYSVEGTLARSIMNEPTEIPCVMTSRGSAGKGRRDDGDKVMVQRRCTVDELSFAAHVDFPENSAFIEEVGASVVILVHGEQHNMGRLKSALLSKYHDRKEKIKIYNPKNCEEIRIPFKGEKIANVVGQLAKRKDNFNQIQQHKPYDQILTGVLVQNDFKLSLMAPEDLREYAGLTTTVVTCRQRIPLSTAGIALVKWALEGMFGGIEVLKEETRVVEVKDGIKQESTSNRAKQDNIKMEENNDDTKLEDIDEEGTFDKLVTEDTFRVMDSVVIRCKDGFADLEWEGNILNDGVADAVMAILLTIESSPAAVKYASSRSPHNHHHHHSQDDKQSPNLFHKPNPHANITPEMRLERIMMFIQAQFGDTVTPLPVVSEQELLKLGVAVPGVEIKIDGHVATVRFDTMEVECKYDPLRQRVKAVVERAADTVAPFVDLRAR